MQQATPVGIKIPAPVGPSPLDVMKDGHEFESLLSFNFSNVDILAEIRRSIGEVEAARGKRSLCYIANVVNGPIGNSIDGTDDLPFREMVASVPPSVKEIDVILVTPGGLANQVVNFVNTLRPRFNKVNFILLDMAMSAGSIFIMSGDEIVMSSRSKFGPIDPQVPNKEGRFVPAQSILLAINDIKERGQEALKNGEQPDWTDIQLLKNIDIREVGAALGASNYSIQITKEFLEKYKFATWAIHSHTQKPVTPQDKADRAEWVANILCNHSKWKSHGHFIDRVAADKECKIKVTHSETIRGLDKAMRRMWALFYWIFENTPMLKILVSNEYCIIRNKQQIRIPARP